MPSCVLGSALWNATVNITSNKLSLLYLHSKSLSQERIYSLNQISFVQIYHLGTVAFGSLILAIIRTIKTILEYIEKKCKKFNNDLTR